jgi:putative ABC transport system ATP-binding protein
MIELKDLGKVYRTTAVETQALEQITLNIEKGEFVSIMGPSGCGKTTLLNTMGLLDKPSHGQVIIDGVNTSRLSDRKAAKIRNRSIGFIFQNFHLIRELNVIENVELPLLLQKYWI